MNAIRQLRTWILSSIDTRHVGAVLRSMGLLYHPLDDRLPPVEAVRRAWRRPLVAGIGWSHALGPIALFLVFVLAATGMLLALHYEPHPDAGRQSVLGISAELPAGWLVRGIHHWAAEVLLALVAVHAIRAFFARAYRAPRQAVWVVGLLLLPVSVSFHFTGTLLPWDQSAYWTAVGAFESGMSGPLLGPFLGDTGAETTRGALGRAFALHVVILPVVLLALVSLLLRLVWKHGIAPPLPPPEGEPSDQAALVVLRVDTTEAEAAAVRRDLETGGARVGVESLEGRRILRAEGCRATRLEKLALDPRVKEVVALNPETAARTFFPHQFLRVMSGVLLAGGALVLLAAWFPPGVGATHDPFARPAALARPWYLHWRAGLESLAPGALATAMLIVLPLVLLFWPLLDRFRDGRPLRPWLVPAAGVLMFLAFLALTGIGAAR